MDGTSMDSDMLTLIIVLVVLIALSAFFSASETAYSSLRLLRMKTLSQKGNKRAQMVVKLCSDYDELLSTILIGNNVVNIAAATLATILFVELTPEHGATVSTIVMTVLMLLFGEITPKSIAKQIPDVFAMAVAPIISGLVFCVRPFNFLTLKLKKVISRKINVGETDSITENELLTIVDEAEQVGGIDREEGELIHNVIEFNDLQAGDIVTPRTDVVALDENSTADEVIQVFMDSGYSRLPVYSETIDNIIGILNEKDFYHDLDRENKPITKIMRKAEYIPPSVKISQVLKTFQLKKTHIAVVIDEYGGTVGLLTMEDILEELVGEIWDEHDEVDDGIKELGSNSYSVPTSMEAEDFFEHFGITSDSEAATVNGWVLEQLDKIPQVGDRFSYDCFQFTVSLVDSRKALEIIVHKIEQNDEDNSKQDD